MKRLLLMMLCLCLTIAAQSKETFCVVAGETQVSVEFFTPRTVHIVKTPVGRSMAHGSLAVVAQPENVTVKKTETSAKAVLQSDLLTVNIDKRTALITFTGKNVRLAEESFGFEPRTEGPDSGAFHASTVFTLGKDEPLYGLGTLQDGILSHRGKHVEMEQSNLQDYQNVFLSVKGWGIYWDNYSRTIFDSSPIGQSKGGMSLSSEVADGIDYYFMLGESADGVVGEMRTLTGTVPMFPLWTYGYWQSKERYKSSRELLDVVRRYRKEQVPLDGIIQDWQYWGSNYTWNAMEFIHEDFLDGKKMIDEVHRMNAHFMISIWASFGPYTKQYRELDSLGLLYDFQTWPQSGLSPWPPRMDYPSGVRVYDAFSPVARDIYWRHLRRLLDAGTDAWWMDSTDPDCFNPTEADYDHPAGDGTWRRYRNAFPLATVKGVYENQRQMDKNGDAARVFIMTRSAFAGQQHYGSGLWSGDVRASWQVLRQQVPLGLNYSLTGCPNFNTDIGGFFPNSYNTRGNGSAARNPQYQELYVRWMQYGLFCPVFRSHGTDCAREVWQFGKAGEQVYDAIKTQIKFRYRLLPYLYSTAWQATSGNASYMRPLFADFPSDRRTWNEGSEFLFGSSILAAPVLEAQYTPEAVDRSKHQKDSQADLQGMEGWNTKPTAFSAEGYPVVDFSQPKTTDKYLPKGAQWYDFWTGQLYRGGQTVTINTLFDRVPMFVRAGSIVPIGPEMQYVGEKAWDNLELRIYPGADAHFTLYEDEGDTYHYEQGIYTLIPMHWNERGKTLTIGQRQGRYPGMLESRKFTIVMPDGRTKSVDYNGSEVIVKP